MAKKARYDPLGVFSNLWFEHYGRPFLQRAPEPTLSATQLHAAQMSATSLLDISLGRVGPEPARRASTSPSRQRVGEETALDLSMSASLAGEVICVRPVSERRTNSFRRLLSTDLGRAALHEFLEAIFRVESPRALFNLVVTAAARTAPATSDLQVYAELQSLLQGRPFARLLALASQARGLLQLRKQQRQLLEQGLRIVTELGMEGSIRDCMAFGEPGKLAAPLLSHLGVHPASSSLHVVHSTANGLLDKLERAALAAPASFQFFDGNSAPERLAQPDASLDLITILPGLHHVEQEKLPGLLREFMRVLRPGGLLLFRDHDGVSELVPMLDIAHAVFNAVTGVSPEAERSERRAFRPLDEWRTMFREAGFQDMYMLAKDDNDPTFDFMVGFVKPSARPAARPHDGAAAPRLHHAGLGRHFCTALRQAAVAHFEGQGLGLGSSQSELGFFNLPEWLIVELVELFGESLHETPWFRFPFMAVLALFWRLVAVETREVVRGYGLGAALGSDGLLMDVVIGLILTFMFLQMQLMALPLRLLYGAENAYELVRVLVWTTGEVDWARVDSGCSVVARFRPGEDGRLTGLDDATFGARLEPRANADKNGAVYLLETRRFAAFSKLIVSLAHLPNDVQILQINNSTNDMQVRVVASDTGALTWLHQLPGAAVVCTYVLPRMGVASDGQRNVALRVPLGQLLSTILRLDNHPRVSVAQIYDF